MPETQQSVSQHRAAGGNGRSALFPAALGRLATLRCHPASAWRSLLATHDATTPKLSALHRLTILYLMLPVLIWLLGWFHWWLGVPAAVLLGLALWPTVAGPWRPSLPLVLFLVVLARLLVSLTGGLLDLNIEAWFSLPATALLAFALWKALSGPQRGELPRATMALLLVAAGWVMLTAAGGVFDLANLDWPKHRALFFALSNGSWPTHTPSYFSTAPLLRYSLGYYLVPGLAGQWQGPAVLTWAVPLYTWGGVALILLLFTRGLRGWRAFLAVLVLICFGGMDIIPTILSESWDWSALSITFHQGWPRIDLGRDTEFWSMEGLYSLYGSSMFNLMWHPHNFLPAALYTLLLIQLRREPRFLSVSGILLAASLFWSPFVTLGLLPLVGVLILRNGLRPFLRWPNLFLVPPLTGLMGVYLASGTADSIPRGWLWERYEWGMLAKELLLFYLIEFMILAGLLWLGQPQLRREPFFLISVVTLLLVPWYQFGVYNDFSSRVSLPTLVLLRWYTAAFVANYRFIHTRSDFSRVLRILAFIGLIIVLGIGTFNLLFQVARANNHHNFGGFRYEHHNVVYWSYISSNLHSQYMTYDLPDWYLSLLREKDDIHASIVLEKGGLIIRSDYDVYLDDDRVIYMKDPCSQADVEPRFFLHVYPVDIDDLSMQSRQRGYDTLDFSFAGHGFRSGRKCLAIRELPKYAISRIETGQLTPGEGGARVLWKAVLPLASRSGEVDRAPSV